MIQRIIQEDWHLIFPAAALLVAALVYAAAAWRIAGLKSEGSKQRVRPLDEANLSHEDKADEPIW